MNQPTQSFATSTTTASLSLATFARLAGGTGLEGVPLEMSPLGVDAGGINEAKVEAAAHQSLLSIAPIAKQLLVIIPQAQCLVIIAVELVIF